MNAFLNARAWHSPALSCVVLPVGMSFVPAWLKRCSSVRSVVLPRFKGACADLSQLTRLDTLELGALGWHELKVVLPGPHVQVNHQSPYELVEIRKTTPSGQYRLKLRLDMFNHATSIAGTDIEIECRHIALVTPGQWARLDWRNVPIDQMPLDSLAWLHDVGQLEALVTLKTARDFTRLRRSPKDAHIVAFGQWNRFVDFQGDRLRASRRSHAFAVLTTSVHAFAVVFGIGSDGQCHVACLDPNFARHVRRASGRDGLEALFVDFPGNHKRYFSMPEQDGEPACIVRVTFLSDPLRPGKATTTGPVVLNLAFSDLPLTWHPSLVKECLATGAYAAFEGLRHAIEQEGYLPPTDVIRALVSGSDGALLWSHKAAEFGHHRALRAWGACLCAAHNAGCLTGVDLGWVLARGRGLYGDNLLAVAVRASRAQVVSCLLDLFGMLHAAGALRRADVYAICSFEHTADSKLYNVVRSRSVARALYRGWLSLNHMDALSDEQRSRLKEALRPVSRGWLPV